MSNGSPGNAKYWQAFVDLQMEIAEALQDRAVERAMDGRVKPVLYLEGEAKMQRSTTLAGGAARAQRGTVRARATARTPALPSVRRSLLQNACARAPLAARQP